MQTFDQFRDSFQPYSVKTGADMLRIDLDYFPESTVAIWINSENCFIEQLRDGSFYTLVYRDDFSGGFDAAAQFVYQEYYLPECC